MAKCEMYGLGKAYDKELGGKLLTLCEIERGTCPYNNEGHKIEGPDGAIKIICGAHGWVEEKSLATKLNSTKP